MNENFILSLDLMLKGMSGIFLVIIVITLIVVAVQKFELLINRITEKRSKKKQSE